MNINELGIWTGCLILILFSCKRHGFPHGKELYIQHCAGCHMEDGSGLAAWYPPLKAADYLLENQTSLPCIIRYGLSDPITVNGVDYYLPMEGIALDETELANLINFISFTWGTGQFTDPKTVSDQLAQCIEMD